MTARDVALEDVDYEVILDYYGLRALERKVKAQRESNDSMSAHSSSFLTIESSMNVSSNNLTTASSTVVAIDHTSSVKAKANKTGSFFENSV